MQKSQLQPRLYPSDSAVICLPGSHSTLVHIASSGRYGFHRNELLTYSNALHVDWCYVVYPPLTAWLARLELVVFGPNLIGFRLFAAIAIGLLIVLTARALGGSRTAMLVLHLWLNFVYKNTLPEQILSFSLTTEAPPVSNVSRINKPGS